MIHAGFNDTDTILHLKGLTQWDRGQKLKITGLNIQEDHIQIHFAKEGDREALIEMGVVDECGDISVDIPNVLLKDKRRLLVYVYLDDGVSGETIKEIQITIKERAKPIDYTDPGDKHLLEQLYEKVSMKADGVSVVDGSLQLMADGKPIGEPVKLPTGSSDLSALSEEEIDDLMSKFI